MTLDQLLNILKENGYKATGARKTLLEVLCHHVHTLLTMDELIQLVQNIDSKINASTVYRNIDLLKSLNLIYKSIDDQGISQVKLICTHSHHHHMICEVCGKIVIYDLCHEQLYDRFAEQHGFQLTSHSLELRGICSDCQLVQKL